MLRLPVCSIRCRISTPRRSECILLIRSKGIYIKKPLFLPFLQENPVSGRKADVIKAAHLCAEAALRLVKPGNQVSAFELRLLN